MVFNFLNDPYSKKSWNKNSQSSCMFSSKSNSFAKKIQNGTTNTSNNSRQCFNSLSIASVFKASASLFNHFFKLLLSFGKDIPEAAGLLFSSKGTCNSKSNWGSVHRKTIAIPCSWTNSFCQRFIFIKDLFNDLLDPCNLYLNIFLVL